MINIVQDSEESIRFNSIKSRIILVTRLRQIQDLEPPPKKKDVLGGQVDK